MSFPKSTLPNTRYLTLNTFSKQKGVRDGQEKRAEEEREKRKGKGRENRNGEKKEGQKIERPVGPESMPRLLAPLLSAAAKSKTMSF